MTTQPKANEYDQSGGFAAALSMQTEELTRRAGIVVLAVLSAIVVAPLAQPGWPAVQVGVLPILRLMGAELPQNTLLAGDTRWIYVLADALTSVGLAPAEALKFLGAGAIVAGAFGAYALIAQTWGPASGLLAGAFFLFLPTQLNLRFVQGVPGDAWFWAFGLWAAWGLARPEQVRGLVVGLLLLCVTLLTWPAATVLAVPPLILLAGNGWWRGGRWRWLVGGWLAGILLVTVVRWPGAEAGTVLYPFQLLSAAWPEATPSQWVQGGTYSLGLLAVVGALFVAVLQFDRDNDAERKNGGMEETPPSTHPYMQTSVLIIAMAVALALVSLIPPAARLVAALGGTSLVVALASLLLALTAARLPVVMPALRTIPWLAVLVGLIALRGYGLLDVPTLDAGTIPQKPHLAAFSAPGQDATFLLLDINTDGQPKPGSAVTVETHWQALRPAPRNYTAFVHLVAPDGAIVVQADRLLLTQDERPSTQWGAGELVTESYTLDVPADAPPGPYTVRTGLYLVETLERLPRVEGGDSVEVQP